MGRATAAVRGGGQSSSLFSLLEELSCSDSHPRPENTGARLPWCQRRRQKSERKSSGQAHKEGSIVDFFGAFNRGGGGRDVGSSLPPPFSSVPRDVHARGVAGSHDVGALGDGHGLAVDSALDSVDRGGGRRRRSERAGEEKEHACSSPFAAAAEAAAEARASAAPARAGRGAALGAGSGQEGSRAGGTQHFFPV